VRDTISMKGDADSPMDFVSVSLQLQIRTIAMLAGTKLGARGI